MAIPLTAIGASTPAALPVRPVGASTPGAADAGGFGASLNKLLGAVDASAGAANTAVGNMLDGTGDVHEAMIALQQAETNLELTVQMRNKIVQAYQDIMRMPV
jgi:flagellar hook-basal body complex protein FliE